MYNKKSSCKYEKQEDSLIITQIIIIQNNTIQGGFNWPRKNFKTKYVGDNNWIIYVRSEKNFDDANSMFGFIDKLFGLKSEITEEHDGLAWWRVSRMKFSLKLCFRGCWNDYFPGFFRRLI